MINVRNLTWRIGLRSILEEVSLDFHAGEFWAILGPNGAGKSTLLKFLAGLSMPESGDVLLDGKDLWKWKGLELARRRALLGQKSIQSLDFLAEEVIAMGRYPHQGLSSPAQDRQAVERAVAKTKVGSLLKQSWHSLSGGEQQRVELARVLAQIDHPSGRKDQVLLLDEPLNNLDLRHQLDILRIAQSHAKKGGLAIGVFHDLNLPMHFCSHCALLANGRCQGQGPIAEVMQPALLESIFGVPLVIHSDSKGQRHLYPQLSFPTAKQERNTHSLKSILIQSP